MQGLLAPVRTVTLAGEAAAGCRAGGRSLNAMKGKEVGTSWGDCHRTLRRQGRLL